MSEEQVQISREEYEKLKQIEADTEQERQKPFSIYDKSKIPIGILDGVIIGGIAVIVIAIIVGVMV